MSQFEYEDAVEFLFALHSRLFGTPYCESQGLYSEGWKRRSVRGFDISSQVDLHLYGF